MSQEKVEKLIDYISVEPTDENDKRLGFKFPFFASEILASENVFIIDRFFEEEEEPRSRKNTSKEKEETKSFGRSSSIIEINMNDDSGSNNEAENKEKSMVNKEEDNSSGNSKDDKILGYFSREDKVEEYHENKPNQVVEVVPDINENLKVESKENKEVIDKPEEIKADIVQKQVSETSIIVEEKRKTYHNLDYFFKFLLNKGPLNYVLCGYFYKIFNHLSNYKNAYVIMPLSY